ncbi:MAG: sugar ABC transporter permease, partial [Lachnospiraceae bacterium]|nr:sugar ABC transporter permease [Lachnospiraceae bacterium]
MESVKRAKKRRVNYLPLILMMLPGIAYMIVNNYLPMFGITIAFKNLDYSKGIFRSEWVGFKNFEFLFRSKDFFMIIRNTILYNIVFILGGTFASLAIAVMMTELGKHRIAKVLQPIICFPNMISIVIVTYLVYGFLGGDGWINNTLLKGDGISWYSKPEYWPFI